MSHPPESIAGMTPNPACSWLNWVSLSAILSGWVNWLPTAVQTCATLVGLIWCCLMIYDRLHHPPKTEDKDV